MAVTITDHRTTISEADATTGWNTGSLFTADPSPVESTGSLGIAVNTTTADIYFTRTALNVSSALIYVWTQANGTMDTLQNGGVGIHLGDGTNRISFHVLGSDTAGFSHITGPVRWTCAVIDTASLPTFSTARAGSLANLNLSAITQFGATYKTLSKALGGSSNCFTDIIRVGDPSLNDGAMMTITGGTSVDPGTFLNIADADRSTANLQAYGILRELGTGIYSCQGPLRFGNATGTASSWFEETNAFLTFQARGFLTSRYKIVIRDNGVGTTTFKLGNKVGTGTSASGTDGCSIIIPSGVGCEFDSQTDTNVTDVFLYGSSFSGFSVGFKMRQGQEFIGSSLRSSGTFTPAGALVYNSQFVSSTATAAMEVTSIADMNNVIGCTFTSNNRAIRLTTAGTYTFDGLLFSNNTFDVENASTGAITINAINGCNVSSTIETNGGSTTIVNARSFALTGLKNGTEVRIYNSSTSQEIAGVEDMTNGIGTGETSGVTVSGTADDNTFTYVYQYSGSDVPIFIVIINYNYQIIRLESANIALTNESRSIPITQVIDRNYNDPNG